MVNTNETTREARLGWFEIKTEENAVMRTWNEWKMIGGPKLRWKGVIQGIETKHQIEELVSGKFYTPTQNREKS